MNYSDTLSYLYARLPMFHRIGAAAYKPNLHNTIALCDLLGNPQHHFASIHVAGTNGKGSISHMLASILQEKGLKTGLYTSPHLNDFRERIRINGKMIPKTTVTRFIENYREDFEKLGLSFFEMTVGLAFDYFRNQQADIAVIEVGLGGRLDSTNVITPIVSVISNIGYDHMQFLGDTLEKIAGEKAGIIKPGIPVIVGETQGKIYRVFKRKAEESHAEIRFADATWSVCIRNSSKNQPGQLVLDAFRDRHCFLESFTCPLTGHYQLKNIATVLAVCEKLNDMGFTLSGKIIRSGIRNVIRNTGIRGRWQVLDNAPLTICDTGHNEDGLREVLRQVRSIPHEHLHFVIGFVNDKEIGKLLKMMPGEATYYFCKANIPRGLDAVVLREQATALGLSGQAFPTVREALDAAKKNASPKDIVFIGGSTFVVAEVL